MDIETLPFNAHVGIKRSNQVGCLLELDARHQHENHLGTVHAGALYALAEASSGEFLLQTGGDSREVIGVVRRATAKYGRPANGKILSRATTATEDLLAAITTVEARGKALVDIAIDLTDTEGTKLASFTFSWFLTRREA
jgi:acyl-coenzyme A thioesterase PaaI-like protein